MPPIEPQNNNDAELEAILLENQNQSQTLDDIKVTNEVQALEHTKTNDELRELNSSVDILIEKISEPVKKEIDNNIAIEINGGDFTAIEGPKGDKGEKGDKGDKPTPAELVGLIKPLIPAPIKGDKGEKGDTGEQGIQGIQGKTGPRGLRGLKGERGVDGEDGKDGRDGKDLTPDTPENIKKRLLKAGISINDLKDGKDIDAIKERVHKLSSKTVSLSELDDVDLSNAEVVNGKYVIGAGGDGDVVGPASATNNAIARYDSTTGKLIQDSGVTLSDDIGDYFNFETATGKSMNFISGSELGFYSNEADIYFQTLVSGGFNIIAEDYVYIESGDGTYDFFSGNNNAVLDFSDIASTDKTFNFPNTTGNVVVDVATQTLTNKRITKRVTSEVSSATPTINTDNSDVHKITALATNITSMTTNLSGTPTDWQLLAIEIVGTATRNIVWGASFADGGLVDLPLVTNGTVPLKVLLQYGGGVWNCLAVA